MGALIGGLITVFLAIFIAFGVFNGLHLKLADSLYSKNEISKDIVIVSIDDDSTKPQQDGGLGLYTRWTRDNYTELLSVLQPENPKVISFDILFDNGTVVIPTLKISQLQYELDEKNASNKERLDAYEKFADENADPTKNKSDADLAAKFAEFENVIIAFNGDGQNFIMPIYRFANNAIIANVNAQPDDDGVMRRVQPLFDFDGKKYDDFALATVKKYLAKDELKLPLEDGKLMVNYFGDPFNYKMVSFVDVLNGDYEKDLFKDKIVLVGLTAFKEINDKFTTPKSNKIAMPGVEFRANEIQTILDSKFLNNQSKTSLILSIFVLSAALTVAFNFLGIALSLVLAFTSIGTYLLVAHFAYSQGIIINMVYPFIAIVLSYLASWVYKYFIADKGKREMKSAFGHYVSDELVEQIAKNPDMVKLGGEKRIVTVFFSDIKNSTGYSEKTPIELWVQQINEYFTAMETVLKSFGGTLDKYEGDAIMGFWNAPVAQEDHVYRAFCAALSMKKTLIQLHQKWQGEGKPLIEFRIGINTGEALVGNFGSQNRFDYTVMGDTVNTASRLESSANKAYGTSLCVAGFEVLINPELLSKFILRELDVVLLPGKKEPVKLFELICVASEVTADIKNMLSAYANALAAYRRKDYASAIAGFESLKNDVPSQIMLERCQVLSSGSVVTGLGSDMVFAIANK